METGTDDRANQIIAAVWKLLEPVIEVEGLELLEVEYRRESPGWVLRLFLDRPEGITVEHCAQMSRVLGDLLDVADVISNPYHLEVSSPGLNRPLRKPGHFLKQLGRVVEVRTQLPINNRRSFKGTLRAADDHQVAVDCDGHLFEIALADIERARLRYFDSVKGDE
jgi:ribosome maturation factor RimP